MKIDTDGTYTLQYTAVDSCGNETVEEREVVVGVPRTVLYQDGTFIINEQPKDRANNILLHGNARNTYPVFKPNGSTNTDKYIFANASARPWNGQAGIITAVEFGEPIQPTNTAYWCSACGVLESFDTTNLDTSNVTSMVSMFNGCSSSQSLDLSGLDTGNVTSMAAMFLNCRDLTSLNISSFNTSNVENFGNMFGHCESLPSLNVSGFDTSKALYMWSMFSSCHALQSLDLSSFDTSNVTLMQGMFEACYELTSINFGNSFDTSKVTSMASMFEECKALATLDVSGFNTSRVTTMSAMFSRMDAISVLDLSSFNTRSVTNMDAMFYFDRALTTIFASNDFVVTQVSSSTNMFAEMSTNLVGGAGTTWAALNPTNKSYAHIDGGTADPGYFTAKP